MEVGTGNEEVPGVKTKAKGDVNFRLSSDDKGLTYILHVKNEVWKHGSGMSKRRK
jgi:hypothetical protein